MKQKISVVFPIYNAETELAEVVGDCLDVVSEISHSCEIIIVDDASTDASSDVAETLEQEFPQVSVISHSQSRGAGKAILHGLQRATGDIVLIYYMTSDFPYPQAAVFTEGMAITDAMIGRFVSTTDDYVGMAMFKQHALKAVGEIVADPKKLTAKLKSLKIHHLELRYAIENQEKRQELNRPHFSHGVKKGPYIVPR